MKDSKIFVSKTLLTVKDFQSKFVKNSFLALEALLSCHHFSKVGFYLQSGCCSITEARIRY